MKSKHTIHNTFASFFEDLILQKAAYLVSKKLEEGSICLDLKMYSEEKFDSLSDSPLVSTDSSTNIQPFVLAHNKLYLHRYFNYESVIVNKIEQLLNNSVTAIEEKFEKLLDIKNLIVEIFPQNHENGLDKDLLIPWQLIASLKAVINDFSIITGGPGTGKTTTIAKLLIILFELYPNISVALTAPTGKAASRLNESLFNTIEGLNVSNEIIAKFSEIKAQTLHRLLGVSYDGLRYKYIKDNPLKFDILIVDESSMIDVVLMAKLMDAVESNNKLILIGDKNQLASVEAGSIFGDLCKIPSKINTFTKEDIVFFNQFITNENEKIKFENIVSSSNQLSNSITELKRSYRFNNTEGIGRFSNLVINGIISKEELLNPFRICLNDSQCVKVSSDYKDELFIKLLKYFEDYAIEEDLEPAFEKLNKIKVLCAVREGEFGIRNYNSLIEKHLKNKGLIKPEIGFYDKQPVLITKNDYMLGLFNGDIGIIREDKKTKTKNIYIKGENGEIKSFSTVSIKSYETVFAMTIHKSQGSEFDNVIIVLPDDINHRLLSRELLYTGVTRAKKQVLILGSDEVLVNTVQRNIQRVSGVKERMK